MIENLTIEIPEITARVWLRDLTMLLREIEVQIKEERF